MACTLKELQDTEYEILCKFADFCESRDIPYGLSGGTLLGAIRHNGFIPWDDDIDLHMEVHAFRKFLRCLRKSPIPGLHLCWIDSDPECPFFFAKLMKNGTFMPEEAIRDLDCQHGVWIDIFCYTGIPKNRLRAKLQKKALDYFRLAGHLFAFRHNPELDHPLKNTFLYRFSTHLSRKRINSMRKIFFFFYTVLGSRRTEPLLYCDWLSPSDFERTRTEEQPLCKHPFGDREFWIPKNYDCTLRKQYGDYMTPVVFPCHTEYSQVQL